MIRSKSKTVWNISYRIFSGSQGHIILSFCGFIYQRNNCYVFGRKHNQILLSWHIQQNFTHSLEFYICRSYLHDCLFLISLNNLIFLPYFLYNKYFVRIVSELSFGVVMMDLLFPLSLSNFLCLCNKCSSDKGFPAVLLWFTMDHKHCHRAFIFTFVKEWHILY